MRDWHWSPAEKAVARKAFDKALGDELETVMRQTREKAARIREADDLWKLERWLGNRRREIDEKYDLPVFRAADRVWTAAARGADFGGRTGGPGTEEDRFRIEKAGDKIAGGTRDA